MKAFHEAPDMADKWQWVQLHSALVLDTRLHPNHKGDVHLQAALTKTVTLEALKVNLGAWQWPAQTHKAPRWQMV